MEIARQSPDIASTARPASKPVLASSDAWLTIPMGRSEYLTPCLLFACCLVGFLLPFRYVGSGDTLPNELLPVSIIREGDLDFDEFVPPQGNLPYSLLRVKGRVVSQYPIVPGLLNVPVFLVAEIGGLDIQAHGQLLSLLTSSTISALSVMFMYLCLTGVCSNKNTALWFALTFAFATPVWSVTSIAIWQHGPSLLFIGIALYLLVSKRDSRVAYAGFFLGLAVFNRPPNILIALPLTCYVLVHHRAALLKYLLGASIPAAVLIGYSYEYRDSIISLGQGQGLEGFRGNVLGGLAGLLLSPSRGLLVFSPIYLFAFPYLIYGLFARWAEPLYRYMSLSALLVLFLYAKWGDWWGGHSFGYRMLMEMIPALTIWLTLCWERVIRQMFYVRIAFLALLALSVFFQYLGHFYYPCGFNYEPGEIGRQQERLWDVREGELARCMTTFARDTQRMFWRM